MLDELRSHLHYRIVLPFLVMALLVSLLGSAVGVTLFTAFEQQELNSQLAQASQRSNAALLAQEQANLDFLREIASAQANPAAQAPAVADALVALDVSGLQRALEPYYLASMARSGVQLDRLIAFGQDGVTLIDWSRPWPAVTAGAREEHAGTSLRALEQVRAVLAGLRDPLGDKYAGLLAFDNLPYLFTVVPVTHPATGRPAGGLLLATRLERLAQQLATQAQLGYVVFYDGAGMPLALNDPRAGNLLTRQLPADLAATLVALEAHDLSRAGYHDAGMIELNGQPQQFLYLPLRVRNQTLGILGLGLSRAPLLLAWNSTRLPYLLSSLLLLLGISATGIIVTRRLRRLVHDMLATAQALSAGDLYSRSSVRSRDELGQLATALNSMADAMVRRYTQLRMELSRQTAILESISDGIMVCDCSGRIVQLNRSMRELLDLSSNAALPNYPSELGLRPLQADPTALAQAYAGELFVLREQALRVSVAPVLAPDGTALGDVYTFKAISAELAIDRAKTSFLATISHELRTPLMVIRGNTELLERGLLGPLQPQQGPVLAAIRSHAGSMTGLINNLITLAQLESGSLRSDPEPLELHTVIEEVLAQFREPIHERGLELHVNLPVDLAPVYADRLQLRIILSQLLDNARRYTSQGRIQISVESLPEHVAIRIADTGCGIASDVLPQLFKRFVRGSQAVNSAERGIGLGLAIVLQLVELQHGTISVRSDPGQGSVFTVTVPYARTGNSLSPQQQLPSAA